MTYANVPMEQQECCSCHMIWWMPKSFNQQCLEQKPTKSFYCPAGHQQHYKGESDLDKERRLRQRAEQQQARLIEEAAEADRERKKAKRALMRHKKRSAAGLCPCCNRTFSNMTRHMKSEHPDYNVVPLKAVKA